MNRQKSSVSHNQYKQSSVLHNRDKGKLCVTYEALCYTIGTRGSSVSHNNGWGKSRNQVLNRQESSAPHNRDKGSSVSHKWDKQSSASHNNGWGKGRTQVLNRQESSAPHNQDKGKLCAT